MGRWHMPADGFLIVGGLSAYNANDGSVLWEAPSVEGLVGYNKAWVSARDGSPFVYANPTIVDKNSNQRYEYLQVLNSGNGAEWWRYPSGPIYSPPLLISRSFGDYVYDHMGTNNMVCLDSGTRVSLWSRSLQNLSKTSKGFSNNHKGLSNDQVYFGAGNEIFYGGLFTTMDLSRRYQLPTCVTYTQYPGKQYCSPGPREVLSPITISVDRALLIDKYGVLHAINLQSGTIIWSALVGGETSIHERNDPAVVNGVVIVASSRAVKLFDVANGTELANIPTNLNIIQVNAAPDGSAIMVRTPEDLLLMAPW